MTIFPLTIFPEGGLASSVITTVWVGVFVLCFFNLRFGWVLSGLVVPGYLVPLLIVKPMAAAVILVEAIMAYALVWLFSEVLSRGRFPSLFGRDRFMGLILASIAVRLLMDGYLLPHLADWLDANFDRRIDWHSNLQSFGLVIVSLMANQFWKPGLARGLFATVVTLGLTWLIVRYGLMEFTNFRISGVSYLYEGLSSSILASPKAYIILVLTAMIASHMNVRYGWDFSGILIPALIALQWYQPGKILTSLGEAVVIYCIALVVLRLPLMANVTLEGGRKLLLFFNISFAWKMLLGWFVVWQGLEVKTTDLFGFGYLLSTLIAIKAHDKDIFPRLARSTLQVSLIGAVLGNIVGFAFSAASSQMLVTGQGGASGLQAGDGSGSPRLDALVVTAVGDAHVRAVRAQARPLGARAAATLADLVELLEAGEVPSEGAADLLADQWRVQRLEGGRLAISRADGQGHELLVYHPAAGRDLAVIVPDPTLAPGLAAAGLVIQASEDARWLVLGAPAPPASLNDNSVPQVFDGASKAAQLLVTAQAGDGPSQAQFANRTPGLVDLSVLRRTVPGLAVSLQAAGAGPVANRGVLALDRAALAALARRLAPAAAAAGQPCRFVTPERREPAWSTIEQLAFLRFEVAAPLVGQGQVAAQPDLVRAAARLGGYAFDHCRLGGRSFWNLHAPLRDEAQVLLADGPTPQRTVLTYRDRSNQLAARMAIRLSAGWQADALFIAPQADGYNRLPQSSFDVVWQELVRRQDGAAAPVTFQFRAADAAKRNARFASDVVLVPDRLTPQTPDFTPLLSILRGAGIKAEQATGDRRFADFEARPGMALRYFAQAPDRRYITAVVLRHEDGRP